jgi:asparagine synthase (glutamine-hydrolysing)
MTATLSHRGPDGEGIWIDEAAGIALGNRRLAIIDISARGHQPMQSPCGRYVITTNGEIYNFRALRGELESRGQRFAGNSDTEVMLAAISVWGLERALVKFNGMFAFALWDSTLRLLHLGRDRIGEKPLYYGWSGGVFLFGSELKALRAHSRFDAAIDRNNIAIYLRHCYIPAPYSIYTGISKVMPGTTLTVRADGTVQDATTKTYWSAKNVAEQSLSDPIRSSPDAAVEQLTELLSDSVRLRLESDRPVGVFLSGGVDSCTIAALMCRESSSQVQTFSIGFEEADEAVFAREVAKHLGTRHTDQYITAKDAIDIIPRLPFLYDEPFADSSQIPTCLISMLARPHVSVALTGDGGDELFCGYERYPSVADRWSPLGAGPMELYRSDLSYWPQPADLVPLVTEPSGLLNDPAQWMETEDFRLQMMLIDTLTYLPDDLLVKMDRASMGVGMETRTPFLDHRLIEFAWRLPMTLKVHARISKWILRQVLYRHVPPALVDRPKQGFAAPLYRWLTTDLRDWAEELIAEPRLRQEGFFDPRPIRDKWKRLLSGESEWKYALWSILMFQSWLEQSRSQSSSTASSEIGK